MIAVSPLTFAFAASLSHRRDSLWRHTTVADLVRLARVAAIGVAVCYLATFLFNRLEEVPRSLPVLHWLVLTALLVGSRLACAGRAQRRLRERPLDALKWEPVLLLGAGERAALFTRLLRLQSSTPFEVVGILDDRADLAGRSIEHVPVLGTTKDLEEVTAQLAVHGVRPRHIVLADIADRQDGAGMEEIYAAAGRQGLEVTDMLELVRFGEQCDPAARLEGLSGVVDDLERRWAAMIKRAIDVVIAASLLIVTSPIMAAIALCVRQQLGSPVIFHQIRPGRHMSAFTLYKFRTLRHGHRADGSVLSDDQRLTRFGRILRRSRLDELPQLWNVLRGDMALIGPRPLLVKDLPETGDDLVARASVRPGVTGWAQVHGGHQLTPEQKLSLDLWYARNYNLWLDGIVIYKTIRMILMGEKVDGRALGRAMDRDARAPRLRAMAEGS